MLKLPWRSKLWWLGRTLVYLCLVGILLFTIQTPLLRDVYYVTLQKSLQNGRSRTAVPVTSSPFMLQDSSKSNSVEVLKSNETKDIDLEQDFDIYTVNPVDASHQDGKEKVSVLPSDNENTNTECTMDIKSITFANIIKIMDSKRTVCNDSPLSQGNMLESLKSLEGLNLDGLQNVEEYVNKVFNISSQKSQTSSKENSQSQTDLSSQSGMSIVHFLRLVDRKVGGAMAQRLRLERIKTLCKERGVLPFNETSIQELKGGNKLNVNDNRKLMVLYHMKSGAGTFTKLMMQLKRMARKDGRKEWWVSLGSLPPTQRIDRFNNYHKVTMVRHPLERQVALYREKFSTGHLAHVRLWDKRIGTKMIKWFRKNPSEESLRMGHDVSFSEYLQYVVKLGKRGQYEGHWMPYWLRAHPCTHDFTFIGKLETVKGDQEVLLNDIIKEKDYKLPHQHIGKRMPNNRTDAHSNAQDWAKGHGYKYPYFIRDVPKQTLIDFYQLFRDDFELYGYHL